MRVDVTSTTRFLQIYFHIWSQPMLKQHDEMCLVFKAEQYQHM